LLDIRIKFFGDSFIGCQDKRENAVHWLKLEVLQKRFGEYKWGRLTLETKLYWRNIMTTKTHFVAHWASSHDVRSAL